MRQWFSTLSKTTLAVLVLTGAIIFIVTQDPPHSICRTQIENFKNSQKGFLFKDPKVKTRNQPLLDVLIENCKKYNSPASCYGLFFRTKRFIRDFKLVSTSCRKEFASLGVVREKLSTLHNLMIRLAWGDVPPVAYQDKLGWLSDVDMSLFCLIKKEALFFYGSSTLKQWEQEAFKKLKQHHHKAKDLTQNKLKELSIVSENCAHYPVL